MSVERTLRRLIQDVSEGRLTRRAFVQAMVGMGLTAPMAVQLLAAGPAAAQQAAQAQSSCPPRAAAGASSACSCGTPPRCFTPISDGVCGISPPTVCSTSRSRPRRAMAPSSPCSPPRCPRSTAGTVAKDGRWVIWRLKRGVQWHDGAPFTADDVIFNWQFALDPATATVTREGYHRHLDDRQDGLAHGEGALQQAAALLAGRVHGRRPPAAPRLRVREGRGRAGSRRDAQAGRDRAVPARGVPARRRDPGRDQSHLPRAEPAVLRPAGDQVRRRLRGRGAGGAADRRVRLRLLRPPRGRSAQAHRAGRQGPGADDPLERGQPYPAQPDRSVDRGGRRALGPEGAAPVPDRPGRCAPRWACSWTGRPSRTISWAATARSR